MWRRRAGVGGRAAAVLAGEHATAERRPGEYAEPEGLRRRDRLRLDRPVEQGVLDLVGRQRRPTRDRPLPGGRLGGLPAVVVAHADVRRTPARHGVVEGAQRLLEWSVVDPGVHLPQVDVVDAEPLERGVQGADQVAAGGVGVALALAPPDAGLGGQHDLVALADVADEGADQPLGVTVGVARGGVDQRASGPDEGGQLLASLVLVGVAAPRHRAQAQARDGESRRTEEPLLHGQTLPTRR